MAKQSKELEKKVKLKYKKYLNCKVHLYLQVIVKNVLTNLKGIIFFIQNK